LDPQKLSEILLPTRCEPANELANTPARGGNPPPGVLAAIIAATNEAQQMAGY
jgi:hypothetical protein